MKVCLVSTSIQQTSGYSLVAYHILRELSKTCEVAHFATHARGRGVHLRNTLTGVDTEEHADFAFQHLRPFCETRGVDVVLLYNDVGVVLSYLQHWTPPRLWVYLDVVAHGIPPPLLRHIHDRAERIFLMNEYWRSTYPFPKASVVEHGVDTSVVRRLPAEDNLRLRASMNIPDDAILVFNANRNSRRKRLDLTISAFVQFAKTEPRAFLLLMTSADGFYDIKAVLGHEIEKHGHNCASRVLSINTDAITISDDKMNAFYNLADIGLNTSTGEGYGLTALHHATLGQPQVLTALPHYDRNLPAVFIPPLPDREYYEMTEYSGGFHDTFASADVEDVILLLLSARRCCLYTLRETHEGEHLNSCWACGSFDGVCCEHVPGILPIDNLRVGVALNFYAFAVGKSYVERAHLT